ncbi:MAG: prepilin peptidase [Candidatus Eisenbacteria bacterium]|nr:prepilin peptidase [Candidatus Eisenbacteria bacterium]
MTVDFGFREVPGIWIFLGLLGLCLGSFLNVVIHRLPLGLSVARPGSRCPRCQAPIAIHDNIPILSYLLLRGRCRRCSAPIGIRYPAIEALGGLSLLLAALASSDLLGLAVRSLFLLSMIAITWIDLDHRIIPDEISLPGIVLGILVCPVLGVSRLDGIVGAVVGGGALLLVAVAYRAIRGIAGMGMGDVKLAAMLGAFMGWRGVFLTILLSSLVGSILGLALLARRRATGQTALPFGTFLAPAAAAVLLLGPRIWTWYLDLFQRRGF